MAATPLSLGSSYYDDPPDASTFAIRKRNRKPVSCLPCRHRKLKCDRALPACDSCIKRGDSPSCSYQSRRLGSQRHWPQSHGPPDNVQNRMDRLEGLILSMMSNGPAPGLSTATGDVASSSAQVVKAPHSQRRDQMADELETAGYTHEQAAPCPQGSSDDTKHSDVMKIDADYRKPFCVGEAHWAALLNEVAEVRNYLHTQHERYDKQTERIAQLMKQSPYDPGPALLFGASKVLGRAEIMSQIPSCYTCDLMIARYFSTLDPALYILHGPSFRKQYAEHWNDRSKTSIVWIALLFAIMRIVLLSWLRDGDEPPEFKGKCHELALSYRTRVADCLIHADYTLPHEYLIETLVLHLYGEYAASRDANSSVWVLIGMISRLAMRMGYHRDPQHLPSVRPFQGEMRRRVWAFVRQADILFSFQAGLPSMTKISTADGNFPRNIYDDSKFHETCTELPQALPNSEPTPISFLIAKSRLAFGFARALKNVNRNKNNLPYEQVLEVDRELRNIYEDIPEHFKLRSNMDQTFDPIPLIAARFTLANIHHKSLCVVHSRFLEAARVNSRYAYSRRVCLESAMTILNFQAIQHQELRADGPKKTLTKYQTSLTTHDFLLAATIVSAELFLDLDRGLTAYRNAVGPTREALVEALDRSADIWSQMRDQSMEAYKASDILGMLLKKLRSNEMRKPDALRDGQFPGAYAREVTQTNNGVQHLEQMYRGSDSLYVASNTFSQQMRPSLMTTADATVTDISIGVSSNGSPFKDSQRQHTGLSSATSHSQSDQDWNMWNAYVPPLDLSDPVSTLWTLNSTNHHIPYYE